MPLERKFWEGLGERRSRARRTACLTITVFTHARWGGDSDTAPVLNFFPAFILPGFLLEKLRELSSSDSLPRREAVFIFGFLELRAVLAAARIH